MENQGGVAGGREVLTAFFRMETIEHSAKITLAAEMAGEPVLLSSREVAKLLAARARYSVSPPPGGGGGLPVTSDSGEIAEDHVTLTRGELDILIEEAVRKDRARKEPQSDLSRGPSASYYFSITKFPTTNVSISLF